MAPRPFLLGGGGAGTSPLWREATKSSSQRLQSPRLKAELGIIFGSKSFHDLGETKPFGSCSI